MAGCHIQVALFTGKTQCKTHAMERDSIAHQQRIGSPGTERIREQNSNCFVSTWSDKEVCGHHRATNVGRTPLRFDDPEHTKIVRDEKAKAFAVRLQACRFIDMKWVASQDGRHAPFRSMRYCKTHEMYKADPAHQTVRYSKERKKGTPHRFRNSVDETGPQFCEEHKRYCRDAGAPKPRAEQSMVDAMRAQVGDALNADVRRQLGSSGSGLPIDSQGRITVTADQVRALRDNGHITVREQRNMADSIFGIPVTVSRPFEEGDKAILDSLRGPRATVRATDEVFMSKVNGNSAGDKKPPPGLNITWTTMQVPVDEKTQGWDREPGTPRASVRLTKCNLCQALVMPGNEAAHEVEHQHTKRLTDVVQTMAKQIKDLAGVIAKHDEMLAESYITNEIDPTAMEDQE